ncbi:RHS repeat-associated core domain-containing protein [Achromobacter sp. K91]|uniref:RHS repeat-associated core domain-containing protein n=1 Tax=Achromobacter sp. K91 TaxID=2292262 RepID=UPI001314A501|nr:RHS repeat-associated core domain-containing protein [Achromobacter sp. K91]
MSSLCAGTPKITVRDNRGLTVRTLRYNRSASSDVATQYVDAQDYNDLGQTISSRDARFFAEGKGTLNFQYTPALSGQVLQTVSVDAGTSQAFADIEGHPVWESSQGRDCLYQSDDQFTTTHQYDALGRPTARSVKIQRLSGGLASNVQTDIWVYGEALSLPAGAYDPSSPADPRNLNLRATLLKHYDTAGILDMAARGYQVQGSAQRQDRQLLTISNAFDGVTHSWTGTYPNVNTSVVDPQVYSTAWIYNALSQVLNQTDAKGHQQQTTYDMAGRKASSSVTPNGGKNTPVVADITYTADGQIETQSDANDIQTTYSYEQQTTRRVLSITTTRSAAAASAARKRRPQRRATSRSGRRSRASNWTLLQDLSYTYDGVGNVTALSDASMPVAYHANGTVDGNRSYTYDALYQLLSASGRENYVSSNPSTTDSPSAYTPLDQANYRSYTRNYQYDLGGNLCQIAAGNASGMGAAVPTRNMVVAAGSNHAVSNANNVGLTAAQVDSFFDRAGQNTCLDGNINQPMYWTPYKQLYCVVTTYRESMYSGGDWFSSDCELYAYDSEGQRVRKAAQTASMGTWANDAIYLPGLEVRQNHQTGEQLEVIVLDDGARMLNWTANPPSSIGNQQIRYRYGDRQNSCQIETDDRAQIITQEEYYPYGGTAVWAAASTSEAKYKTIRYSGKERDAAGLYYYGMRYYQPWIGRWINPDPAGTVDGQNLYCMVGNNPVTSSDGTGLMAKKEDTEQREQAAASSAAADRPSTSTNTSLLTVDTSVAQDISGPEFASPSKVFSELTVQSEGDAGRIARKRFSNLSDDTDGPSAKRARQDAIDSRNTIMKYLKENPGIGFARLENDRLVYHSESPEFEAAARSLLGSRNSAGSIADAQDTKDIRQVRVMEICQAQGALVVALQRETSAHLKQLDADFAPTASLMKSLEDELKPLLKGKNAQNINAKRIGEINEKLKPLFPKRADNERERNRVLNEMSLIGNILSSTHNKRTAINNERQRASFAINLAGVFKTAASAQKSKGFAFATFGTQKAFWFLGSAVNIKMNPKEFKTYAPKKASSGIAGDKKLYFNKFEPSELPAHFEELDKHLVENNYSKLHAYTKHRIAGFNAKETQASDLQGEAYIGERQHINRAGVPGTHAESILFNELLHAFYPESQNTDFDTIESEMGAGLLNNLKIYTFYLIDPQEGGYHLFEACQGCSAIIGDGINAINGKGTLAYNKVAEMIEEMRSMGIADNPDAISEHLISMKVPYQINFR